MTYEDPIKVEYYKNTENTIRYKKTPIKIFGEIKGWEEVLEYTTGPFEGLNAEEIWYDKDGTSILERVEYEWQIIQGKRELVKEVWYNKDNKIFSTTTNKITYIDGERNVISEIISGPEKKTYDL